jgi:hypothetical protein
MQEIIVAALRRELDGYLNRGRLDQMALLGCDVSEVLSRLASTVPPEEASTPKKKPVKKAAVRKVARGNN